VDTLTVDNSATVASPIPLIRYQYRDHLGSAAMETNETGQVISYEEYHPFGTSAYRTAKSGTDLSLKRYRFTNKERDDETGLYYFGVRYYAAWLGRWTSSDPGGFVDGLNLYVYVRNNPVNGGDELGYETEPPPVDPNGNAINVKEGSILERTASGEPTKLKNSDTEATSVKDSWLSYHSPTDGGGWITYTALFSTKIGSFTRYKASDEKLDSDLDKIVQDRSQAEQQARFNQIYEAKRTESGGLFLGITMGVVALAGAGTLISLLGAGTVAKEGVDFAVDSVWESTVGTPSPFLLGFSDMAEGLGKSTLKKAIFTKPTLPVPTNSLTKAENIIILPPPSSKNKVDFIVHTDGTAMHKDPDAIRRSLDGI
jgi:RHS repeat-associated protein